MMRFATPLLALALAVASPSFPGVRYLTPTGETWVETVPAGAGHPHEGIGRGVVAADPGRVYAALVDYAHWSEFMPFLKTSEAHVQRDGTTLANHVMQLPAPTGERHYQVRFRQRVETGATGKTWTIEWTYVPGSGNVEGHHGSWTLTTPEPGKTLAVLRLYTDPGGLTPHWAVDRGTTETIPWIFDGLRQQIRRSRYDGR